MASVHYHGGFEQVGDHMLFCHCWRPGHGEFNKAPRALLYIAHGIAEHGARYAALARFLADGFGFVVCSHDHLGHGRTVDQQEPSAFRGVRGDMSQPWAQTPRDLAERCFRVLGAEENSDLPLFLYGHSMGSVVAQIAVALEGGRLGKRIRGLVLSGPPCRPDFQVGWIVRTATAAGRALMGTHGVHRWQDAFEKLLLFGQWQRSFPDAKVDFAWICRDEAAVREYIEAGCGHNMSMHYWSSFLSELATVSSADFSCLKGKPVLIQLGSDDPLARMPIVPWGNRHRVLECLGRELKEGQKDGAFVKAVTYMGFRHEPHSEPAIQEEVFRDIGEFMERALLSDGPRARL